MFHVGLEPKQQQCAVIITQYFYCYCVFSIWVCDQFTRDLGIEPRHIDKSVDGINNIPEFGTNNNFCTKRLWLHLKIKNNYYGYGDYGSTAYMEIANLLLRYSLSRRISTAV